MTQEYIWHDYKFPECPVACSTVDTSQPSTITIPIVAKSFNYTIRIRTVLRKSTMNKRQWKKLCKNSAVIKQCGGYVIAYQEIV